MPRGVGPWQGEPTATSRSRLPRVGLVLLLTAMLLVPTAAAQGKPGKIDTREAFHDCEGGDDWLGFQSGEEGDGYQICTRVSYHTPTLAPVYPDSIQPEYPHCPPDFDGFLLNVDDTTAGVCVRLDYAVPDMEGYPVVTADAKACEIPNSDREGSDPVIRLWDGYVVFCVLPIADVGNAPETNVSTEPCEPETTDPEVRVGDGRLEVCLQFTLLGQTPTTIGQEVHRAEETARRLVPGEDKVLQLVYDTV